jgi:30S ribosomal protein S31
MGKGDKKTKRGKLFQGSYGITRPRKKKSAIPAPAPAEKPSITAAPVDNAPKAKATPARKPVKAKKTEGE